jgi:ABC-type amino acid transport substrate-binding protein
MIILLIGFLLVATVCGAEEDIEPKSAAHYLDAGVTIVAPVQWKPFAFEGVGGQNVGYAIDFWKKWSEKSGVPIRFIFMDWPETLEAMKNGEADIHCAVYYSDERTDYMEFSDSIYTGKSVLAIIADGPVDCSNALHAGRVGVVKNSYTAEYVAANYPDVKTKSFPHSKAITEALLEGEVEAVVTAYPPLVVQVREKGALESLNICRTIFYLDAYAGVQKGQTELLQLVNDGVAMITASELKTIESRWFIPAEEPELDWLPAVLPAVMVLLGVAVAVVFWASRRV